MRLLSVLFLSVLLQASPVWAKGKLGNVAGRVVEAKTAAVVPGAAVWIKELALGNLTDANGRFLIRNVRPGRYTLQATLIGYKSYRHYNIEVKAGDTARVEIVLEETILPFGEEQVVIGKKPLLDLTQPSTARIVDRQELDLRAPIEIKTIIQDQLGVASLDNEIHIRGGRTYEGEYLVDGISISDPLVRQGFALNLNPTIVDEMQIISGGLSAQYGSATSGVVEVTTRAGGDKLSGSLKYRTDNFGFGSSFDCNSDYLDFNLSGPDPLGSQLLQLLGLGRRSNFFFAASLALTDTYLPHGRTLYSSFHGRTFAPRGSNYWTLFFKWQAWFKEKLRLTASYNGTVNINQDRAILDTRFRLATYSYGYPFEYEKDLDNYNTFTQFSNQQIFRLETNPQTKSGGELTFSRFFTNLHSDVNGKRWDNYNAPIDTLPKIIQISPDSSYYTIYEGDGFYDAGDGDLWYDHYMETYSLALKYHKEFQIKHTLTAGLSYDYQTLQMTDIFKPYLGEEGLGLNYDLYKVYPSSFAAYIQNKLNFSGAVFDLGVRYDVWVPGKYAEDAALSGKSPIIGDEIKQVFKSETSSFFGRRARAAFSPRVGLSYLLSQNFTLFTNYNRLAKKPAPQYVYARLNTPARGAYQLFGNPSLDYEKVTTIEGGIKYLRTPQQAIAISVYMKDIRDYIAATQYTPDPRFPREVYLVYFNLDFAESQGIEISLEQDFDPYIRTFADAAFSKANGERSLPSDIVRGLKGHSEGELYTEVPFDWDIPWQFSIGANINVPADKRPSVLGVRLFSGWNLYLKYSARAGNRYTPYREMIDSFGVAHYLSAGQTNSKLGPYQSWLNLSFQKRFKLMNTRFTLYIDAENLLDHKNVTMINPLTGKEYRLGDIIPYGENVFELPPEGYHLPIWDNPTQFLAPRRLKLGIGVNF